MPPPASLFSLLDLVPFWVWGPLTFAVLYVLARRQLAAHRQLFVGLAERRGLQLSANRRAVSGRLEGREVKAASEYQGGPDSEVAVLHISLSGPGSDTLQVESSLLEIWADEAQARQLVGAPAALSARRRARLNAMDARVAALLWHAEVFPLLLRFMRANHDTWIEAGELRATRGSRMRRAGELDAYVDEGLALAAALSAALSEQPRAGAVG